MPTKTAEADDEVLTGTDDDEIIDASGEAMTFEPFAKGDYEGYLEEWEESTANTGTEMVTAQFVITQEGPAKNRKLWKNYFWSSKAIGFMKEMLIAAGADPVTLTGQVKKSVFRAALDAAVGKPLRIGVKITKQPGYNDKNEVTRVRSGSGKGATEW